MASGGQQMDEALVARAVRVFRWVTAIQFAFFVTFGVGGFLLVDSFGKQAATSCVFNAGSPLTPSCSSSSTYVLPIVLLAVGFFGMLFTMVVAAQWAIRTLGVGVMAYLRRRRRIGDTAMGPASAPGTPGSMTGRPMWPGGMPPGTPGSPTGPPLR